MGLTPEVIVGLAAVAVPGLVALGISMGATRSNTTEIVRLRDKIHNNLSPTMTGLQGDVAAMAAETRLSREETKQLREEMALLRREIVRNGNGKGHG